MKIQVHVSLFLSTTIGIEITDGAEHVNATQVTPMVHCPALVFLSKDPLSPSMKEECSLYAIDAVLRKHTQTIEEQIQNYGGSPIPEQASPDGGAKA